MRRISRHCCRSCRASRRPTPDRQATDRAPTRSAPNVRPLSPPTSPFVRRGRSTPLRTALEPQRLSGRSDSRQFRCRRIDRMRWHRCRSGPGPRQFAAMAATHGIRGTSGDSTTDSRLDLQLPAPRAHCDGCTGKRRVSTRRTRSGGNGTGLGRAHHRDRGGR